MQKVKVVLDQTDNDDTESVIKVLEKRLHISVLSAYTLIKILKILMKKKWLTILVVVIKLGVSQLHVL